MGPIVFILIDFGNEMTDSDREVIGKYLRLINKPECIRYVQDAPKHLFDETASSLLKELGLEDGVVFGTDFTICHNERVYHGRKLSNFMSSSEVSCRG